MPKYYEDKEEEGGACAGVREDFKACLLQHDCVVKIIWMNYATCAHGGIIPVIHSGVMCAISGSNTNWHLAMTPEEWETFSQTGQDLHCPHCTDEGKKPSECLKEGYCKHLQLTFFECKRSLLDTRSRFRGRKGY